MAVPTRTEALSLLLSTSPSPRLLQHVTVVAEVAAFLAYRAAQAGLVVDRRLVETAALLHDVDKALPRRPSAARPRPRTRPAPPGCARPVTPELARAVAGAPGHAARRAGGRGVGLGRSPRGAHRLLRGQARHAAGRLARAALRALAAPASRVRRRASSETLRHGAPSGGELCEPDRRPTRRPSSACAGWMTPCPGRRQRQSARDQAARPGRQSQGGGAGSDGTGVAAVEGGPTAAA